MEIPSKQLPRLGCLQVFTKTLIIYSLLSNIVCKLPVISLSPSNNVIMYANYSQNQQKKPQKLLLRVNFSSSEFILDKKYEHASLYLDNHTKTWVQKKSLNKFMKIRYQSFSQQKNSKGGQVQEESEQNQVINGIIGFKHNSEISKALSKSLDSLQIKFWFKIYEDKIVILNQSCRNPIFPPYRIEIRTDSARQVIQFTHPSLNSQKLEIQKILKLIKKKTNPFSITHDQLFNTKFDLKFLNQIQSIPLKNIIDFQCLKVVASDNYECDLSKKSKDNIISDHKKNIEQNQMNFLLMQFDPIICSSHNAIQVSSQQKVESQLYYWSHIFLILIQLTVLFLVVNKQKWQDKFSQTVFGIHKEERSL